MDDLEYTLIVERAEDREGVYYGGYFPDLPGCGTTGRTLKELRGNAREALEAHIGALKSTGQEIPPPTVRVETITLHAS